MGLNRIDGGNFKVKTQEISIKKIEIKQSVTVTNNPVSNNAVSAKRFEANYQANLRQFALNANVTLANFNPTLSPIQAKAKADDIIRNNGGKNNLDTEAVGQELAEIAKTNPADAWAITQAMLGDRLDEDGKGKVKEGDKDEIAQSFTRNLTEADLKNIANSGDGKSLLERFQSHLLAGNSHTDERADALKLETAIKGYPPPQFTGNPEQDIKIIANDLANIPPDKRDDYLIDVMNFGQYGTEVLQHAGVLNDQERDRLANALNQSYQQNPALVSDVLKKSLDAPIQGAIWEQTGLADVIKRTGNDQMIAGYAKHAMGIANSGRVDSYSDTSAISALTALGGMSPEGLQNFINFGSATPPQYGSPSTIGRFIEQNNANFFKMLNGAIDNYQPWIIGNAVGDLMNVASQMTGGDGKLASEALKIFSAVAPKFGDEIFANGAISEFFVKHADQILESLLQNDAGQAVLQQYFKNTLFSLDTKPEVRAKIEDAISNYVGNQVANSGTDAPLVGDKIGELFGTIQAAGREALAAASKGEKDKIKEFTVGTMSKIVGAFVGKGITAIGTGIGGPAGTVTGVVASQIVDKILGSVFKVADVDPAALAQQFIADLNAAGGDVNLGENLLEDLNDKFNQVLAQLNAEIAKSTDPAVREQLDEVRTRLEQLLRSMNDSYQIRLDN